MKRYTYLFILLSVCLLAFSGCCNNKGQEEKQAKYIFLFIGDGMGATHVATAESWLSYKNGKLGGEQLTFTQFPVLGLCTTYSADKPITCSSAAATAIASGIKTRNNSLGIDAEGNDVKSMAYDLSEEGYNIAIMSSVPVNHATPGSFFAHAKARGDYYDITMQIPATGFEFFGGSGFIDHAGKDGKETPAEEILEEKGYTVCYGNSGYEENKDCEHMVLLQPSSKEKNAENYTVGDDEVEEDMTLAEMLGNALEFMGDEEPFFVMCEGGEIDWAAHDNQTMPMVEAILKFDDAVKLAYEFYLEHPDETLIVVTADHETGGITLGANGSYDLNWKVFEEAEKNGKAVLKDPKAKKALNDSGKIGWTTGGHTGAPVPVYAVGLGAERFSARIDNAEIHDKILVNKASAR